MLRKQLMENRLRYTYFIMCFLNFTMIVFISSIIYITTKRICDMQEARTFLSMIDYLPKDPMHSMILSITAFVALLIVMRLRLKLHFETWQLVLCFLVESGLCLLIMERLYFSSNSILLLMMADLLTYITSNTYRFFFMVVLVTFYLGANYDFLSARVSMTSFYDYINCYNSFVKSLLLSVQNTLASLNIIVFIIYMVFLVQDKINENKRFLALNEELQSLNEQLKEYADIREKMGETRERNRLAREIHDTLGHTLTGLSVGLDACVLTCELDPKATRKQLSVLSETARRGLKDVRRSVDKLRPDALEHYTLKVAIDKMIKEFQEITDVTIHFVCHLPKLTFDSDEEEVIYRIIQEGMTNAVRHGHATKIYISIAKEENTLILIIEDNGIECENIKPDFGLHHMQERIELLKGNIRFYGSSGFIIIAEIPIREGLEYD